METAYSHLPDHELLQALPEAGEDVFKEIFDRYWGILFLHAVKMLRDEEEARDLVQELFIDLWKRADALGSVSSLSSYLYVSVRNRVINVVAHKKTRNQLFSSLQYVLESPQLNALDLMQEKQLAAIIEDECRNLPPKMREVFELSRKSRLSHKEIARVLQISDKTVKKQVGNAIKAIKLKISYLSFLSTFFAFYTH